MALQKEKYDQAFLEILSLKPGDLGEKTAYDQIPTWDSIGHMALMGAIEAAFEIALDAADVMNFSSYTKGFEILAKYGILIDKEMKQA